MLAGDRKLALVVEREDQVELLSEKLRERGVDHGVVITTRALLGEITESDRDPDYVLALPPEVDRAYTASDPPSAAFWDDPGIYGGPPKPNRAQRRKAERDARRIRKQKR